MLVFYFINKRQHFQTVLEHPNLTFVKTVTYVIGAFRTNQ